MKKTAAHKSKNHKTTSRKSKVVVSHPPFLGPVIALGAGFLILFLAKTTLPYITTSQLTGVNPTEEMNLDASAQAAAQPELVVNPNNQDWSVTTTSPRGQETQQFLSRKDSTSKFFLGSQYALSGEIDICANEPPCVEAGTFDVKISGNAYTTPLFLSKNRQTGEQKYIFQLRAYGFQDSPYLSAKVVDLKRIEEIKQLLSSL